MGVDCATQGGAGAVLSLCAHPCGTSCFLKTTNRMDLEMEDCSPEGVAVSHSHCNMGFLVRTQHSRIRRKSVLTLCLVCLDQNELVCADSLR